MRTIVAPALVDMVRLARVFLDRALLGREVRVAMLLVTTLLVTGGGCGSAAAEPTASRVDALALASAVDLRVIGCRAEPVRGAGSMIAGSMIASSTINDGDGDPARFILTAAHVVAGAEEITVRPAAGTAHDSVEAIVVAIDPVNDVALLAADVSLPALAIGELASGDQGVAIVFRDDHTKVQPFTIVNPAIVNIADIYGENTISRSGYRVAIAIVAGDSGAVLVGPDGQAGGVLYAKSRSTDGNAFATSTAPVAALVAAATDADAVRGVDTGECP